MPLITSFRLSGPASYTFMLYFAIFTMGYFLGVFTFLAMFPPTVKEIEEQEKSTLKPILSISEESKQEQVPSMEIPATEHSNLTLEI